MLKRISKLLTGLLIAIFLLLATYGVNLSWNGHMAGGMKSCPLMGEMGQVCQMDLTQHIAGWQKLFVTTVQSKTIQVLLISLLALAAALWFFERLRFFSRASDLFIHHTQRNQVGGSPHNYLLEGFSSGILRKRE